MKYALSTFTSLLMALAIAPPIEVPGADHLEAISPQLVAQLRSSARISSMVGMVSSLWLFDDSDQANAYQEGKRKLNEGKWREAVQIFQALAKEGDAGAAGAMYWAAYARSKMFEYAEALTMIKQLREAHPGSSWIDDAKTLAVEIRAKSGQAPEGGLAPEDELKLLALGSLSQVNPERGMALLKRFLEEDHNLAIKEKALFVLTQMDSAEKLPFMVALLENDRHQALHDHLIRYLGMMGGEQSWTKLMSIYRTSDNLERKAAVLESLMIGNRADLLADLMDRETNQDLRMELIQKLGILGEDARLDGLMRRAASLEEKRAILHAYFLAGNGQALLDAAREAGELEYQAYAIQLIGMKGDGENLMELYRSAAPELKPHVVQALFLGNQIKGLEHIATEDADPEIRKQAIHRLAMTGSKDSSYWLTLYRQQDNLEIRQIVLHALMVKEDSASLIQLARGEKDIHLKSQIVRILSQIPNEETQAYLLELLEK